MAQVSKPLLQFQKYKIFDGSIIIPAYAVSCLPRPLSPRYIFLDSSHTTQFSRPTQPCQGSQARHPCTPELTFGTSYQVWRPSLPPYLFEMRGSLSAQRPSDTGSLRTLHGLRLPYPVPSFVATVAIFSFYKSKTI
jgi:hypothetical protein